MCLAPRVRFGHAAALYCLRSTGDQTRASQERNLLRRRVRSGVAATSKREVVVGPRFGLLVDADRYQPRVVELIQAGQSCREIRHQLGLSKNTVLDNVRRARAA